MLAHGGNALGRGFGDDDADDAVVAADGSCADARKLVAPDARGGLAVEHERRIIEVAELPAASRLHRCTVLIAWHVAGLDGLLVVDGRIALEVVVHVGPPVRV